MDTHVKAQRQLAAKHVIKRLEKRGMNAVYVHTGAEAKAAVLDLIPAPCSVIRCGSESVAQLDLWKAIEAKPGVDFINPYVAGLTPEESLALRAKGLNADVMVASTNALTLDGQLVNVDGIGNRVAAMCFGPKRVILVVGMNKVVGSLDAAMDRVRTVAAPINSLRVCAKAEPKPPCFADGLCHQCVSPGKICNVWVIIEGQKFKDRLHVVLVEEDLGY